MCYRVDWTVMASTGCGVYTAQINIWSPWSSCKGSRQTLSGVSDMFHLQPLCMHPRLTTMHCQQLTQGPDQMSITKEEQRVTCDQLDSIM
jgi:hypothetical protein